MTSQPRLIGSAQPGTRVDVYANATCSGPPLTSGSAVQLAGPGIAVTAADDGVSEFSMKAIDLVPLASACSAPISYTQRSTVVPPSPPRLPDPAPVSAAGVRPTPTPTPICIVPLLAGKTLARAKAALTAAACKLGTVRKPRPRKGKPRPPLVVKSSSPTTGARPAGGEVSLKLAPKPRRSPR